MAAPSTPWVLYSVFMYGIMYSVILHSAWREMAVLAAQVKALTPTMAAVAVEPLREKNHLFRCFIALVTCELLLEALCRYLLAARAGPFLVLVLVYEGCSTVLVVLMGVIYRPREYSPFFFMMPTSLEYSSLLAEEEAADREDRRALRGGRGGAGGAGGGDARAEAEWRARRNRSRLLSRRAHSREREDDAANIERLRVARVQR